MTAVFCNSYVIKNYIKEQRKETEIKGEGRGGGIEKGTKIREVICHKISLYFSVQHLLSHKQGTKMEGN
jgi:hypothetical protein